MPCSVPFLSCRRPVFSIITFPLLLRIAVYIDYVLLNMPAKWSPQMAPGTKFLRLLGSLCARTHLENQQEPSDTDMISFKKKLLKCIWKPRMYGVNLEIYIDWLNRCLGFHNILLKKKYFVKKSSLLVSLLVNSVNLLCLFLCSFWYRSMGMRFVIFVIFVFNNEKSF